MDLKERLAELNEVLKHRSLIRADGPIKRETKKRKKGTSPTIVHRTRWFSLWVPMLKNGARLRGLRVPSGEDAPDKEQFRLLMQQHLESLILSAPERAQEQIEEFSDMWKTPDLDQIQLKFPVSEWPAQLVICDSFNRTLERIGWGYRNLPQRPWEEPCSLGEFLATVWEDADWI
jgi:hypothetical protein